MSITNSPDRKTSEARFRLLKVYKYLEALNQLRNPVQKQIHGQPWVLWFRDLPIHDSILHRVIKPQMPTPQPLSETSDSMQSTDFILKVQRPELTRPPDPPIEISAWLQIGWQNVDGKVAVHDTRRVSGASEQIKVVRFEDDSERIQKLRDWVVARNRWAETERPARQSLAVFDRLYALQAQIERESERLELVLGDGLLDWPRNGYDNVHHPVLLQRLSLQFDPSIPEFTLVETDQPPELYTALFRSMPEIKATAIGRCRSELELNGWHPLGGDETSEFLKRLASQISAHGEFTGPAPPKGEKDAPRIGRDPVIFLRPRTLGFTAALESILLDLPVCENVPSWMANIVGVEAQGRLSTPSEESIRVPESYTEEEDILLAKAANPEQLQIVRRLEKYGAVLVQGPPGTGKTYSIANLIGHLLAHGKTILVTSYAEKALKVLRSQVVEPLQPLCVSVLSDSRDQMESAVDAISERLASTAPEDLEREAAVLASRRTELIKQLRALRGQLLAARQDEYRPVVVAGEEFSPSEAARIINSTSSTDSWVPSPVSLGDPLPLSEAEVGDLYRTNITVSPEAETELSFHLPSPGDLINPTDFEELIIEKGRLSEEDREYRKDLWSNPLDSLKIDRFDSLLDRLSSAIRPLGEDLSWRLAVISAGREEGNDQAVWEKLLMQIEAVSAEASKAQEFLLEFSPELPDDCLQGGAEQVAGEITEHLKRGGKLGRLTLLMNSRWKALIDSTRVNGQPPKRMEHFEAISKLATLRASREALRKRWQAQVSSLGGPDSAQLGTQPEKVCRQYSRHIREWLDWFRTTWSDLEREMVEMGLNWKVLLSEVAPNHKLHGDLLRLRDAVRNHLPAVIKAQKSRALWYQIEARLAELVRKLDSFAVNAASSGVVQRLQEAVKREAILAYRQSYERLIEIRNHKKDLISRHDLLAKLEGAALGWAAAIRNREAEHGRGNPPGEPASAWRWRQIHDELERRGRVSLEDLQEQIEKISKILRKTTAVLIEKKAWFAQVRRTSLEQRQALRGWKEFMRRVGRGTGIRAPRLLAEARKLIPVCQSAVPVWIMPLSRVVESFDPQKNRFDVVIIDEASQADVMAMAALYMGREIIIVGDHEQVSPLAVSQNQAEVQQLIDEHIADIPNANLYDGQMSIYDLAKMSFEGMICLREHFRCVPQIIQFSNDLSYDGKIKPLRDPSSVSLRPHTVAYRVEGDAVKGGAVNEVEARTIASLLIACTEQSEYEGATFGVISLVGQEQAEYIEKLLRHRLPPDELFRRRLQCGNSASFQGDERDVMFLSIVDAPTTNGPLSLRREGAQNLFKKRFNVAASRARDQMWVVYSLDPEVHLQPQDIRRQLIVHAQDPEAGSRKLEQQGARVESEFEKQVLRQLLQAGYRVTPQWKVGAYRIDLVVEGGGKRLAVECDGDRWHPPEKLEQDMERQAILERLGWRFVRIRGSQFFRAPDQAMAPVFERLNQLEISPEESRDIETSANLDDFELKERVVRRAAEIRREWSEIIEDPLLESSRSTKLPSSRRRGAKLNDNPESSAKMKGKEARRAEEKLAPRPAQMKLGDFVIEAEQPLLFEDPELEDRSE